MSQVKRANFCKEEKEIVNSIIVKYKNIIENKSCGRIALEEKEKCWKNITEEFNSRSSITRTTTQLKEIYENGETVQEAVDEASEETVPEIDEPLSQLHQDRRKRQHSKKSNPFEEEKRILFREIMELKRQKLASEIEVNKLKIKVYKAKLEILAEYKHC